MELLQVILAGGLLLVAVCSARQGYYYPPVYGSHDVVEYEEIGSKEKEEMPMYKYKSSDRYLHRKSDALVYPYSFYKKPGLKSKSIVYYRPPQGKSLSTSYKSTQKCFQCEYRPPKPISYDVLVREPYKVKVPKMIKECEWEKSIDYVYVKPRQGSRRMYGTYKEVPKYEKICFPKTIFETKTRYRSRYIKKQRMSSSGGFDACKGPLDQYSGKRSGVDDWECTSNCYVKKDKRGTITRGCYSGQYKVDPNRLGCHYQGDSKGDLYCFCQGDHCNGGTIPSTPSFG